VTVRVYLLGADDTVLHSILDLRDDVEFAPGTASAAEVLRRVSSDNPDVTLIVVDRHRTEAHPTGNDYALTPQERIILSLIGEGLTNRQIGIRLHLAEKTVKNYVSRVLGKLGVESRTQAALHIAGRKGA
jgi:DNA-binding NarL/FixJ family response regulator